MARALLVALLALATGGPLAVAAEPGPRDRQITVSFSGDLLVTQSVLTRALALGGGERYEFEPLFEPVRRWIQRPDLAFCHVETPVSDRVPPAGSPPFSAPPELAKGIAATGWDACSIASNHVLDQGQEGIEATGIALDRAGVGHTGAYSSAGARRRPLILAAGGVRVALLSYTANTNDHPLPAPYSVNLLGDPAAVVADARRARGAGADAVIVNIHWTTNGLLWTPALRVPGEAGYAPEYVSRLGAGQVEAVTSLLGSKAITAVVAQGPHVVQPIRRFGGKYAVFSEGNLISGAGSRLGRYVVHGEGLIALLTLASDSAGTTVERVRYVPVLVRRPATVVSPARPGSASYERTVSLAGRGDGVTPVR